VVGKGKMPLPGNDPEEDEDDDPVLIEPELLVDTDTEEFELDKVPVAELELPELIERVWLMLELPGLLEVIVPVWLELELPELELLELIELV
jgi:hypothetical protein